MAQVALCSEWCPPQWGSEIVGNFPGEFGTYFSGREPLAKFWDHIGASHACLVGHPLHSFPDYKNMVVQLRLHGNPAAQRRGHSLDVLSLNSLVGFRGGSSWDSKGLVFAMVDGGKMKGHS